MNQIKCYIEERYKVDHSQVDSKLKTKFVTLGNLIEGKPICAWCLQRLCVVADAYGYHRVGDLRGGTNVEAGVSLDELIKRSPLKSVFKDYNVTDVKVAIDRHLFELEPVEHIQPSMQSQIDRISGAKTVR
jgi:hypothetical protein